MKLTSHKTSTYILISNVISSVFVSLRFYCIIQNWKKLSNIGAVLKFFRIGKNIGENELKFIKKYAILNSVGRCGNSRLAAVALSLKSRA